MDTNIDNLKRLLDKIKTVGFFSRLFNFRKIKNLLIDANGDLQKLVSSIENLKTENLKIESNLIFQNKDLDIAKQGITKAEFENDKLNLLIQSNNQAISKFTSDLSTEKEKTKNLELRISQVAADNVLLKETNKSLSTLNEGLKEDVASKTTKIENLIEKSTEFSNELATQKERLNNLNPTLEKQSQDLATYTETNRNLQNSNTILQTDLASVREKKSNAEEQLKKISEQNIQLLKDDKFRQEQHSNSLASLNKIQDQVHGDRNKEVVERNNLEIERIRKLKETWNKHQDHAKNIIKNICNKHTVEYIDKVPFKGEPDNTLKICDEYVIFDAKSPANDDLSNFPSYLKDQAEKAKKYAKQENVKTDIFFVVPSNTLEKMANFVHNLGDHNVFIISVDSLEQIILSLKKIEDYEFVDQLSPEERENVCRVIGKFVHLTKRRIQIDSFFTKQFIELAYKSETDLPKDILDKVKEFEKSEKINPPIEKRAKAISTKELEADTDRVRNEAASKGIFIDHDIISTSLNELQLYKTDTTK